MVKKIYPLFLVFFVVGILFSACSDNDDYSIDEEWMRRNLEEFYALAGTKEYKVEYGVADPKSYILWRESSFWKESEEDTSYTSSQSAISPIYSDSIICRYEGWFFDNDKKKIIFDSTDNPTYYDNTDPNKMSKTFWVGGLVDGWRTALYHMKEGDEWDIVMPYSLGYGFTTVGNIPAFTTLYFSLKLIKVKQM